MLQSHKFFLFFFILSLLLVGSVVGQPPFETQTATDMNELQIIYPKTEFFPLDVPFKLHFHVYNGSGYFLSQSQSNCSIHIYDNANNHVLSSILYNDSNLDDVYVNVTSDIYSVEGDYTYLVWCNSVNTASPQAGFVSNFFKVTRGGVNLTEYPYGWLPVILAVALLSFISFYVSGMIKNGELDLLKLGLFVFGFVNLLFLSLVILLAVLNPGRVDLSIGVFISYFSVTCFMVMVLLWMYGLNSFGKIVDFWFKLRGKR